MHSPAQKVLLGTANYQDAQVLKRKLEAHAIDIALVHNQATCGGGCSVKVEVWSNAADAAAIGAILAAERGRELESMGYDLSLADQVFDPSRAEATCPACGTSFATSCHECPDCGLSFAVPGEAPVKKGCGTC